MEIPIPHRARAIQGPPAIYVHDSNPSDRFRISSRSSSYNSTASPATLSGAMAIPNARDPVPPPLPPPRHLADIADNGNNGPDIAWKWGNYQEESAWESSAPSLAPGSSLYGSYASGQSSFSGRPESSRRTSSSSTLKSIRLSRTEPEKNAYARIDEGYQSLSGTSIGSNK